MINYSNKSKITFICYLTLVAFTLASIILYAIDKITSSFFSLAIAIGICVYLYDEKSIKSNLQIDLHITKATRLCLNIIFIILFTASILSTRLYFYNKGLVYYLLVTFLVGLIFVDILALNDSEKNNIILLKIIILALNIFNSNLLIFPYGIGASGDTFYQIFRITLPIVQTGFIPNNEGYYFFPIHQILVSISSQLFLISPEKSYFIIATIEASIGMLFIYNMTTEYINYKSGYISSLIYISSAYIMYHVSHPFQITFALIYAIMLIYIIFKEFNSNLITYRILYLLILITLIFTHPHSSAIVFIMILIITLCELYLNARGIIKSHVMMNKIYLFLLLMLVHWIFYSLYFKNIVYTANTYFSTLSNEKEYITAITSPTKLATPLRLLILDKIYYISLTLSTIGFFQSLKKVTIYNTFMNSFSFFFISILMIGMFINLPLLGSNRLFFFLEAIGFTFLSAYAIIHILDLNKVISKRNISMLVIIMVLFFFTISSSVSGIETSLYIKSKVPYEKRFDTPNERKAILWTNVHIKNSSKILISNNFIPYLYSQYQHYPIKNNSIDWNNVTKKYVLFNNFDMTCGLKIDFSEKYGSVYTELDRSTLLVLNKHDKYYTNGIVNIYYT